MNYKVILLKSVIKSCNMDSGDSTDCETQRSPQADEMSAAAALVLSLQNSMVSSLQQAAMMPVNSPAATALNLQALESYITLQRLSAKPSLPSMQYQSLASHQSNSCLSTIQRSDLSDDDMDDNPILAQGEDNDDDLALEANLSSPTEEFSIENTYKSLLLNTSFQHKLKQEVLASKCDSVLKKCNLPLKTGTIALQTAATTSAAGATQRPKKQFICKFCNRQFTKSCEFLPFGLPMTVFLFTNYSPRQSADTRANSH